MGFGQAVSSGLRKFFTFAGRAPRSEYWYFYLFFILSALGAGFADGVIGAASFNETGEFEGGGLLIVAILVLFIPQLAVTVRRLHDLDRSGWWWWLGLVPLVGGLVLLVWFCMRGTEGNNRYGPNPLNPVPVSVFD